MRKELLWVCDGMSSSLAAAVLFVHACILFVRNNNTVVSLVGIC